ALGNEYYIDQCFRQRLKQSSGEPRHAYHSASFKTEQGNIADAGDTAYGIAVCSGFLLNHGSCIVRGKGVFYYYGDSLAQNGLNGWRIKHFGAKMRKFHRFLVRYGRNDPGAAYPTRICGHHARYICPYFE